MSKGADTTQTTDLHDCSADLPYDVHGPAIDSCVESDDGTLWVGNGEYSSQVMFYPYCGMRAKKLPPKPISQLTQMRQNKRFDSPWVQEMEGKPDLCAERLDQLYGEDSNGT